MNYCPECGRKVEDIWNRCPYCGIDLDAIRAENELLNKTERVYSEYDPNAQVTYHPRSTRTYQRSEANTFGIISITLAVVGCFICGIPLGILAVILGIIGTRQDRSGGTASFGIILGAIDCCCAGILLLGFSPFLF